MSSAGHDHPHHHGILIAAVIAGLAGVALGGATGWLVLTKLASPPPTNHGAMNGGGMPPATVRVGTVQQQELQQRVDLVGRLHEVRRATVAAEVEGRVLAAPIEAGDTVVSGQTVLAEIDGVWSRLALREAEARVAAARATLDQSRRDYEYLRTLQERGSAKPKEVEDAGAKLASDEAALAAAEATLDLARQRVDRLKVLAPFDGVVIERLVERGQWLQPGAPVAQVITTGSLDAEVFVPERHVPNVRVGQRIDVTIEPLREQIRGEVTAVVPSAPNAARTFPVKIRVDDQQGRLKAGMSVIAHLPVSEARPRLTVPRDAVLFSGGDANVWVATQTVEGGRAALLVPVQVQFGLPDRYVVEPLGATLEPGAQVVVQGGERLIPNQPLMIDPGPQAIAATQ